MTAGPAARIRGYGRWLVEVSRHLGDRAGGDVGESAERAGDATTSPGKNAVHVSQPGVLVGTSFAQLASGTIQKGKRRRILELDLTLIDSGSIAGSIGVGPVINGLALVMEPSTTHLQLSDCPGTVNRCTATGLFWLDLDAAEAAHPGVFINQPLVIELWGFADMPFTGMASLRARLVKKQVFGSVPSWRMQQGRSRR